MELVVTDLDGTLLDCETYSFAEVAPGLESLTQRGTPLVLCTSKTRVEVEFWRKRLDNRDPFIVENGGAVFVPATSLPGPIIAPAHWGEYSVWELGTPYPDLVRALQEASRKTRCRVRGFFDMTVQEVAEACQMTPAEAALAKDRGYDEPFLILDAARTDFLLAAIRESGGHWTRGGRFYHITGDNDKAKAVCLLVELYRKAQFDVFTIGLGDGLNDASFLNLVDLPILIRSPFIDQLMAKVSRGIATEFPGPRGWNEAILRIFARKSEDCRGSNSSLL